MKRKGQWVSKRVSKATSVTYYDPKAKRPAKTKAHPQKQKHTEAVCKTCGQPAPVGTIMCRDCVARTIPWHKPRPRKKKEMLVEEENGNGGGK